MARALASRTSSVFIVDDDGAVRESLQILFERQGWTVCCYPNAEVFLSQARAAECGCLVLDQVLPGLTGLEMLKVLREKRLLVPTIILTGDSDPLLSVKAATAGALAVLDKPVPSGVLLAEVRRALATQVLPAADT
jgi:two-component system response regulator FixJ